MRDELLRLGNEVVFDFEPQDQDRRYIVFVDYADDPDVAAFRIGEIMPVLAKRGGGCPQRRAYLEWHVVLREFDVRRKRSARWIVHHHRVQIFVHHSFEARPVTGDAAGDARLRFQRWNASHQEKNCESPQTKDVS